MQLLILVRITFLIIILIIIIVYWFKIVNTEFSILSHSFGLVLCEVMCYLLFYVIYVISAFSTNK